MSKLSQFQLHSLTALVHDLLQEETHPDPKARLYAVKMRIEFAINDMIRSERDKEQREKELRQQQPQSSQQEGAYHDDKISSPQHPIKMPACPTH